MRVARSLPLAALGLALAANGLGAQGLSAPARGALSGVAIGGAAGLLFAHDACDDDPCAAGAYGLAGVAGSALFAGLGAVIGSQVGHDAAGRGAVTGAVIGGLVGAAGGIGLVAATCADDDCAPTGYTAVGLLGAALLGGVGALLGHAVGGWSNGGSNARAVVPVIRPAGDRVVVGLRVGLGQ